MTIEYKQIMALCEALGVEVPTNVRNDQQLASRLLGQCKAALGGMVNPSDATAAAADIVKDKVAYVATGKVTGTLVAVDTRDATATAEDIALGKTAYVNGVKITGTKA